MMSICSLPPGTRLGGHYRFEGGIDRYSKPEGVYDKDYELRTLTEGRLDRVHEQLGIELIVVVGKCEKGEMRDFYLEHHHFENATEIDPPRERDAA